MQSENLVFASVASEVKVKPPHFIESGPEINTESYLKNVNEVLL